MTNIRIIPCADCQVLQLGHCAKGLKLPRLTTNCFGTGREHKLNLRRRLFEPEAANRCLVLLESRDQRPRGHQCETAHPDSINARPHERPKATCAFLLTLA